MILLKPLLGSVRGMFVLLSTFYIELPIHDNRSLYSPLITNNLRSPPFPLE